MLHSAISGAGLGSGSPAGAILSLPVGRALARLSERAGRKRRQDKHKSLLNVTSKRDIEF